MSSTKTNLRYILTIDPGTKNLGWAIFKLVTKNKARLIESGFIKVSTKEKDWIKRIDLICMELLNIYWRYHLHDALLMIELPENFGSHKGMAASSSGSVGKLMACVFQIKGVISREFPHFEISLIPVRTWKGNLPKERTEYRIQKYWGRGGETSDESDAIGLGDYWIRRILKYKPINCKELK